MIYDTSECHKFVDKLVEWNVLKGYYITNVINELYSNSMSTELEC